MARTIKKGLEYFPLDVDFFQDIRIRKLIKYQGGKAITVYALLLCNIYRNGYYVEWDKELPFIISEQTGYTEAYIQEVIDCCMNIGLLSKELFESEKVLTSKGIQERYASICSATRRNVRISEYCLLENFKTAPRQKSPGTGQTHAGADKSKPKTAPKPKPTAATEQEKHSESPSPDTLKQPSDNQPPAAIASIPLTESIPMLKKADEWIENVGIRYSRNPDQIRKCLDDFALVCSKDSHPSLQDCRSHFCRWLAKQKPEGQNPKPKAVPKPNNRIDSTKEYLDELERQKSKACTPAEYIRSKGYDPAVVTMANLRDEKWLAQNPPTLKPT